MERITKKMIEERVSALNEMTGHNYHTDFYPHYGGWSMYVLNESKGRSYGFFGFESRKTNREFFFYLKGILRALQYSK